MVDPASIKAGAQFVVTVARDGVDDESGQLAVTHGSRGMEYISPQSLTPLPAASPTAEIDAQIVELVDAWDSVSLHTTPFRALLDRRRATLKPKDAVGELIVWLEDAEADARRVGNKEAASRLGEAAARIRRERGT